MQGLHLAVVLGRPVAPSADVLGLLCRKRVLVVDVLVESGERARTYRIGVFIGRVAILRLRLGAARLARHRIGNVISAIFIISIRVSRVALP